MNQEQLFEAVKNLTDKLKEYRQTSTLTFKDAEEKLMLADVARQIYKVSQLDLTCAACVLNVLNMLLAWYEREYPIYLALFKEPEPTKAIKKKK